jgi:site-specific recombinase XerD
VNLEQGYVRVTGKGDKERVIKLGIELRRALSKYKMQYRKAVEGETALFTNDMGFKFERGGIRMMVVRMLHAHIPRQLAKYGPHTLRHTAATIDLFVNEDLDATRRKLGHVDAKTTQRYVHLADVVRQSGLSPMDAVMNSVYHRQK